MYRYKKERSVAFKIR